MKKISKYLWSLAGLLAAVFFFMPVCVQAGGNAAAIEVVYVILRPDGGWDYCATPLDTDYLGISAELTCPNASKWTNSIEEIDGRTAEGKAIGKHLFNFAWEDDVSRMLVGTYRLTNFECPRGYEYDNALEDKYPLSVTITQSDINEYLEWVQQGTEAGTETYTIYVPVKLKGTVSAYLQKPEKAVLSVNRENRYIETKNYGGTYSIEYQYAAKKNGKYSTLGSEDGAYRFTKAGKRLKHGKTYYFRARYYKIAGGKKICGDFSNPVKIKVFKSSIYSCKPVLKVIKTSRKSQAPRLQVNSGTNDFNMYKISYSTKKNGKYKEIRTVYSGSEIQTSTIKELKKGRTYYVRVRFIDKPEYETMYSSYSNKQKVKMP